MLRYVAAVALCGGGRRSALALDVPYLPQTEALCGGAAAAMVMRYWGARDVYPDDFAAARRSIGGRDPHVRARRRARGAAVDGVAGPGDGPAGARSVPAAR